MYEAFEPRFDGARHRFRSLPALVRRLGGHSWIVCHGEADGPRVTVQVLKHQEDGRAVIAVLRVPAEAVPDEPGW